MSEGQRFEWVGDRPWPATGHRRTLTILDALLAGLDTSPGPHVPATAIVWMGVDSEAGARVGEDFDHGHRAWLDRAEHWPEFRAALGTIERLDGEVGRPALAGAFAARPQSTAPVPAPLLRENDPWQQELAEIVRQERLSAIARSEPVTSRYLSLYDAVVAGVKRMAAAGLDLDGDGVVARATLLAAHPDESVAIALDGARLLGWRLRWAADPERERALLLAEGLSRRCGDVHELLGGLARSSFAWVAVPATS